MPFEAPRGPGETNEQYLASVPTTHPAFNAILSGHLRLTQIDPNYLIERIHTSRDGKMSYEAKSPVAEPFETDEVATVNSEKALNLVRAAANISRELTAAANRDARIWVVYTTDFRFANSPTRFDSAYNTEELGRKQAERLNIEYHKSGIPESVAHSNVVPLLVRDELESWDD